MVKCLIFKTTLQGSLVFFLFQKECVKENLTIGNALPKHSKHQKRKNKF